MRYSFSQSKQPSAHTFKSSVPYDSQNNIQTGQPMHHASSHSNLASFAQNQYNYHQQSRQHSNYNNQNLHPYNRETTSASLSTSNGCSFINKLLNQPPRRNEVVARKARIDFKVDIEDVKREKDMLKIENTRLEKAIVSLKLELTSKQNELKELKAYANKDQARNNPKRAQTATANTGKTDQGAGMVGGEAITVLAQRKKMAQMKMSLLQKDAEINRLRHIPQNNMLKQLEIQKQELVEQTLRLKAILSTRNDSAMSTPTSSEISEEVIRLLKQESQKLKAQLRIADYQKSVLKAKKSSIKKVCSELRSEVQTLKKQVQQKQIQLLKLDEENKSLLFRRVNQMRRENRENQELSRLRQIIQSSQAKVRMLEHENQQLTEQANMLREREKMRTQAQGEAQEKYDAKIRSLIEQLESVQEDFKNYRENYAVKPNINQRKSFAKRTSPQVGLFGTLTPDNNAFGEDEVLQLFGATGFLTFQSQGSSVSQVSQKQVPRFNKVVKQSSIRVELQYLRIVFRKFHIHIDSFFQQNEYSIEELIEIFCGKLFCLSEDSARKVARYLVEDTNDEVVQYDPRETQTRKILISIANTSFASPYIEDRRSAQESWSKMLINCKQRLIKKISEMLKTEEYVTLSTLQTLFADVFISPTLKDLSYLQTEIVGIQYVETGGFSLNNLSKFIQKVTRQSQ